MSKSTLFIGSSADSLPLAQSLERGLASRARVLLWNKVFGPSDITLDRLLDLVEGCDFGVFVFSPDDLLRMRGKNYQAVRDNVVFEAGVFMGALGRKRTLVLTPSQSPRLRLLSDIAGLTLVHFDDVRVDGSQDGPRKGASAGLGQALVRVRQHIAELGPLSRTRFDEIETLRGKLLHQNIAGRSLMELLQSVAPQRRPWRAVQAGDLMKKIDRKIGRAGHSDDDWTDDAFWWLLVHGVLTYQRIDKWWDDEDHWEDSVHFTEISPRGLFLLDSLRS